MSTPAISSATAAISRVFASEAVAELKKDTDYPFRESLAQRIGRRQLAGARQGMHPARHGGIQLRIRRRRIAIPRHRPAPTEPEA